MNSKNTPPTYHERSAFGGFFWGLFIAGFVTLFWGPRFPWNSIKQAQDTLRDKIDETVNADPVNEGIQQGKDVARQLMGNNKN